MMSYGENRDRLSFHVVDYRKWKAAQHELAVAEFVNRPTQWCFANPVNRVEDLNAKSVGSQNTPLAIPDQCIGDV